MSTDQKETKRKPCFLPHREIADRIIAREEEIIKNEIKERAAQRREKARKPK